MNLKNFFLAVTLGSAVGSGLAQAIKSAPATSTLAPAKPASAAGPVKLHVVNAEVRKVDQAKGKFTLRHEEIPNLGMGGMTMAFQVSDKQMLKDLKAGDKIRFQSDMIGGKATVVSLESAKP